MNERMKEWKNEINRMNKSKNERRILKNIRIWEWKNKRMEERKIKKTVENVEQKEGKGKKSIYSIYCFGYTVVYYRSNIQLLCDRATND